jgi:hypothetical protein
MRTSENLPSRHFVNRGETKGRVGVAPVLQQSLSRDLHYPTNVGLSDTCLFCCKFGSGGSNGTHDYRNTARDYDGNTYDRDCGALDFCSSVHVVQYRWVRHRHQLLPR